MSLEEQLIAKLKRGGPSHRRLKPICEYHSRFVKMKVGGVEQEVLNFASNDYLGLSSFDVHTIAQSQPSSRLLSGNLLALEELENEFAHFMGFGSATILQSGFAANLGLMSCLSEKEDLVFADRLIHASLIDGMQLGKGKWTRFKHNDVDDLAKKLESSDLRVTKWVVVESMFSMDGDLSPLLELVELKKLYKFHLIVDEAHSFGVWGKQGRGLCHELGVVDQVDLMTFNFSKALAAQGGIILGPQALKPFLINRCRPLIYSTATPWGQQSYLSERLHHLKNAEAEREFLKKLCQKVDLELGLQREAWSPVIPIVIGDHDQTREVADYLLEHGIYCPAILPPTVPEGKARLRLSLHAKHREEDIQTFLEVLKKAKETILP